VESLRVIKNVPHAVHNISGENPQCFQFLYRGLGSRGYEPKPLICALRFAKIR
jgi:hypothetical protein